MSSLCAGGTNFRGEIVYAGEGMGADVAPALFVMNPVEPYNTTSKSYVYAYMTKANKNRACE
jgi:hypothetical protein